MKYYLHPSQVPELRAFVQPFCRPDPHARGEPPIYTNTTVQLDTPDLAFYRAREGDAFNRFKLRVRAYRFDDADPVTCEVKRKLGLNVMKRRARIPFFRFGPDLFVPGAEPPPCATASEARDFAEFTRLLRQTWARPVCLIRYQREAWCGRDADYARVTFDTRIEYQMTRSWTAWGREGIWRPCDVDCLMGNGYSGVVLELKTVGEIPLWMQECVCRFGLTRQAVCKYALAIEREHMLLGAGWRAGY